MDRLRKFRNLRTHAWYKKQFCQLPLEDICFCLNWIEKHNELNKADFEAAVNRMFIDKKMDSLSKARRKRKFVCQELISAANS